MWHWMFSPIFWATTLILVMQFSLNSGKICLFQTISIVFSIDLNLYMQLSLQAWIVGWRSQALRSLVMSFSLDLLSRYRNMESSFFSLILSFVLSLRSLLSYDTQDARQPSNFGSCELLAPLCSVCALKPSCGPREKRRLIAMDEIIPNPRQSDFASTHCPCSEQSRQSRRVLGGAVCIHIAG